MLKKNELKGGLAHSLRLHRCSTAISEHITMTFFIVFFLASLLFVPKFANPDNLYNILVQSSDLIILSCGMTFVFLNGGIDFSVTAVLPLSSVLGAFIMTRMDNVMLAIPLAVLTMVSVGLLIGVVNGLAVTQMKMPSFIATMASQLVFTGIALTMTQSKTIGGVPNAFNQIAQGSILGIKTPIFLTAIVVATLYYLLHCTVYGRQVFAVGTNHQASRISGIQVKRIIFSLFIISSICAAIASIIMTGRLGAGVPSMGKDVLMDVVAAIVIGGTNVSGGEGTIGGSVLGAIAVVMLNNSLNLLGVEWFYIMACKGALILIVSLLFLIRDRGGAK